VSKIFGKKKHFVVFALIIMLTFGLALTGCGPADEEDPGVDPDPDTDDPEVTEPQHGGTANVAIWQSPNTFIEFFSLGNHAIAPARLIYSSLMRRDGDGQYHPDLAEDWEISEDAMEFTFHLNPDATFHDGEPVTAHDIKFTFECIAYPEWTGSRTGDILFIEGAEAYNDGEADEIEGIEIVNDHELVLHLEEPYAPFLERIYFISILPEHLLEDEDPAAMDETDFAMRNPVGSGAFEFVEFAEGEYVELEASDDFHLEGPYLDSVIIHVTDQEVAVAQLETGELDGTLSHYAAGISPDYVDRLEGLDHIDMDMPAGGSMRKVTVNHEREPMDDPKFRQALSYAVDREGFVQAVLRGYGAEGAVPLAPDNPFMYEGAEARPYDPDKARELLEDIDYDFDQTLELLTSDTEERQQMAELLQEWWGEIGVDIEIRMYDFPTQLDHVERGDYDLATMGYTTPTGEPDAVLSDTLHSRNASPAGWNFSRVRIEEIDELLDKARGEVDEDARRDHYVEFQRLLPEYEPEIYVAVGKAISARNTRMENFEDHLFYRTQKPHLWWINE